MDPQQTYCDLLDALKCGDTETARDLALDLQHWLARGGFAPQPLGTEIVSEIIAAALRPSAESGRPGIVFTLVCEECDAGDDITSEGEALAAGWSRIQFAPDLPQANFVGLCPECRRQTAS